MKKRAANSKKPVLNVKRPSAKTMTNKATAKGRG